MDTKSNYIEEQLRQLDQERKARETSRAAIEQTRDKTADTQQSLGLMTAILEGAKSRAEILEQKADAAEAGLRRVERTAATLGKGVVGLAFVVVLLLAAVVVSMRSATHGTSSILMRLGEIEKRGVEIRVTRYQSTSFDPGVVICNGSVAKADPCGCLYEVAVDTMRAAGTCEPMASVAKNNVDAALVIAMGGHDSEKLGASLQETFETNRSLAEARALVVSDALRSSLDEVRRGMAERQRPFPITRYMQSSRGAHYPEPMREDRTVTLTVVRAETSP